MYGRLNNSRAHTVKKTADDWLEHGLPGRADRTREIDRDALAPLVEKIGKRPLRGRAAGEVEAGMRPLTGAFRCLTAVTGQQQARRDASHGMPGRD